MGSSTAEKQSILVVGGAGYIGSHMIKCLMAAAYDVTTLDNLSSGYRDAVIGGDFIEGDFGNAQLLEDLFSATHFDAVMHFASFIQVSESVSEPAKYYFNNVTNTQVLLDAMVKHDIPVFIFSSTAAIFGDPEYTPIDENHPTNPINPYGRTKLIVEQMLADYETAYGLRHACLRYFNAAGADPSGQLGERHEPETHLIPVILQAASGRRSSISVFGTDYDTQDGSCMRDYIHVEDLVQAHLLALRLLLQGESSRHYNLGNGSGFSVLEVIATARQITGQNIVVSYEPRRQGDPACLVADSSRVKKELGWTPRFSDLDSIIFHAWNWEQRLLMLKNVSDQ